MHIFLPIILLIVCFTEQALTLQLVKVLCGYTIHNCKIINMILLLICASPSFIILDPKIQPESGVMFMLFMLYYLGRLLVFSFVYRKMSYKLLYFFLISINIPQIYQNLLTPCISNSVISNIIAFTISLIILSVLLIYIKRKNKELFISQLIDSLPKKLYVISLMLIFIASFFTMLQNKQGYGQLKSLMMLLSMIGVIAAAISFVLIGISESEKRAKVTILANQIENQVEYYEKIERIYGEFRSFRHDFKNHILCLRSLIASNNIDRAVDYLNDIEKMSSVEKKQFNTGNIIIDALMNDKSEKAKKANTAITFRGYVPTIGISNADLCVIIANAVDNAIEACAKDTGDSQKTISIESDFKQGYFFFKISNPIFDEVNIKGKNKLVTSKKDKQNHGFGVANIMNTVEKYDGSADISTENDTFVLDIQLLLKMEEAYAQSAEPAEAH